MTDLPAEKTLSDVVERKLEIAGFWRRLAALAIDLFILFLPLFLLGLTLFQWATSLGQAGRLIGFAVALVYFGLLNSKFSGGRTLGKWLFGIRVVDRDGKSLSPMRSIVRFLIIAVPYFLSGIWINVGATWGGWFLKLLGVLLEFVIVGGLGAIIYLYVFNRRTRQSLHDLIVGSFVVRDAAMAFPIRSFTPRLHLIVIGFWLALSILGPLAGIWLIPNSKSAMLTPLSELQTTIEAQFGVTEVKAQMGKTTMTTLRSGTSTTSFLQIAVVSNEGDMDAQQSAIARKVLALHPDLLGNQVLIVLVQRKFDFGLAGWSENHREALNAAAWQNKLAQSATYGRSPSRYPGSVRHPGDEIRQP